MSKKLIAVASAAALALSALVGVAPASAATPTGAIGGFNVNAATTGPGTEAVPMKQNVPYRNTLDTVASAGEGSATLDFDNIEAGDILTVTTTGKVRLVTAQTVGSADVNVATLGTQSFSKTFSSAPDADGDATTGDFVLYASITDFTHTEIKWSVSRTGSTTSASFWIEGVVGEAYAITDVVAPATLATAASTEIRFKLRDVFGNQLETTPIAAAVTGAANSVAAAWDASNKWHDATITSSTSRVFILTIDGNGSTSNPDDVAGFADESISSLVVINGPATAAANTAATAQIAALTAQLAASRPIATSVTKKKYNALAKRWNSAFPGQKVALKQ